MAQNTQVFHTSQGSEKLITWDDVLAHAPGFVLLYAGIHMAIDTPKVIEGPDISLAYEGNFKTITLVSCNGNL